MKRVLQLSAILAATCLAAHVYGQDEPGAAAPEEATPEQPEPDEEGEAQPEPGEAGEAQPEPGAEAEAQPEAPPAPPAQPAPPAPPAAAPQPAAAETTAPQPAAEPATEAPPPPPAKPEKPQVELTPAERERRATLGLSPGAPQTSALPGGVTPAFGTTPTRAGDWRFDFHGFVMLPLRLGINKREDAGAGQKNMVLHAPPMVPGDYETFEYTSVVPDPWVQLNFSYGNPNVIANVIVAARTVSTANGYFNPPDQLGINDAFLTFRLPASESVAFNVNVGAFSNRYGNMGEYDLGRYGTPLIGRVSGMGITGTSAIDLGDVDLMFETGFTGQLTKAPLGVEPAGWNGYADPTVGTSFAAHGHGAVGVFGMAQLGLHAIYTFVQDDRASIGDIPDGHITVEAADLRFTLGRFGHLYTGFAYTEAARAHPVSAVIRVLNAPGGPGLIEEYLGPQSNGNGNLKTLGAQYDFSLGNFLRYPMKFEGDGADVVASLFSIFTQVSSDDPEWDDMQKLKYGAELSYSMLSWFALSGRYDRILPDLDDDTRTTAVISPRLIFRSDFNSHDQVVLQYSRWLNGSGATVVYGAPPERDPTIEPDKHVLSLTASMWW
jgi:hypothetical protein